MPPVVQLLRPPPMNHKRFNGFKNFRDRHLDRWGLEPSPTPIPVIPCKRESVFRASIAAEVVGVSPAGSEVRLV
jgi:hypothetical protein